MPHISTQSRHSTFESIFNYQNWTSARSLSTEDPQSHFGRPSSTYSPRVILNKMTALMRSPLQQLQYLLHIKKPLAQTNKDYALELKQDIEKAISIDAQVKTNIKILPKTLSVDLIQKQATAVMSNTNRHYQASHCSIRAWQINDKLAAKIGADNCFTLTVRPLNGALIPPATSYFQGVRWSYHSVAAVRGNNGRTYVFDPVIHAHQALELGHWLKHFKGPQHVEFLLTPKNSTARPSAIDSHEMRMEDLAIMHASQREMSDHLTLDTLQTSEPLLPIANFAYHSQTNRQGPIYSFNKPLTKDMSKMSVYLDQKLLKTVEFKASGEVDTNPLFCIEKKGLLYGIKKQTFENILIRRGIKRIEITDIPCNLNNPNTFRVLERYTPTQLPYTPITHPTWGESLIRSLNQSALNSV